MIKQALGIREIIFALGFIALAAGLVGYDWRVAAVACGAILLFLATFPTFLPYFSHKGRGK